jgi:hypothetical protein
MRRREFIALVGAADPYLGTGLVRQQLQGLLTARLGWYSSSRRRYFCGINFVPVGPIPVIWTMTSPSLAQTKCGVSFGSE